MSFFVDVFVLYTRLMRCVCALGARLSCTDKFSCVFRDYIGLHEFKYYVAKV